MCFIIPGSYTEVPLFENINFCKGGSACLSGTKSGKQMYFGGIEIAADFPLKNNSLL